MYGKIKISEWDYNTIQSRFSYKLENIPWEIASSDKRKDGYKQGILACKSIVKEIFEIEGN